MNLAENNTHKPRLIILTCGSFKNELFRIKYQYLFNAIEKHFTITAIFNGQLNKYEKIYNSLQAFDWNLSYWRSRTHANLALFKKLTNDAHQFIRDNQHQADLIFQHGIVYDGIPETCTLKSIGYTDYTYKLSARQKEFGRFPFRDSEEKTWIEHENKIFLKLNRICTHSQFTAKSLLNDYQITPEKIGVVGGGLNLAEVPQISDCKHLPPTQPFNLFFIGNEFYRKGGDLLIEAFQLARKKLPEIKLTMITHLPVDQNWNLQNISVVLPNIDSSRRQIIKLFKNADAFVLPSRMETWGDVLIEAMAFGLPCIGIRELAMADIIDDGKTGYLIQNGDILQLTDAILKLAEDSKLRSQMSQASHQKVIEKFTWDKVVQRIFEL